MQPSNFAQVPDGSGLFYHYCRIDSQEGKATIERLKGAFTKRKRSRRIITPKGGNDKNIR